MEAWAELEQAEWQELEAWTELERKAWKEWEWVVEGGMSLPPEQQQEFLVERVE